MLPSGITFATPPPYANASLPPRNTQQARNSSTDPESSGSSFQDHLAAQSKTEDSDSQSKATRQAKAPAPLTLADGVSSVVPVQVEPALVIPKQAEAPVTVAPGKQAPAAPISQKQAEAPAAPIPQKQAEAPAPRKRDNPIEVKVTLLPGAALPQLALPVDSIQRFTGEAAPAEPSESDANTAISALPKVDVPPAARGTANSALPATPAGPVAFAVRVNPEQAKVAESDPQDQDNGTAGSPILLDTREPIVGPVAAAPEQEHKDNGSQDGLPTAIAEVEIQKPQQTFSEHLQSADSAKTAEPEPDLKNVPAEPARQIHVQVAGDGNQRVDLRVIERDGTMSVSVRAADPNLSRTLQEHMPELTSRLEAEHFHAETWIPKANAPTSSSFEQGKSDSNPGYSPGGNGSGQQQGGQRDAKPEWVDELENYARNSQTRRNNLWRQ